MRLLSIFLLVLFYGCSKDALKAPDAYYLNINNVYTAVTSPSLQGTTSHKITDIWMYVNGNFKGAYPVGKMLPVVSYGPTKIMLYAGIKNNGISSTRIPYEFFNPIEIDTTANNGDIANRNLTYTYKSTAKFAWIEDFEGFGTIGGITMKKSSTNGADTGFSILNSDPRVFEGNKCILMSGFDFTGLTKVCQIESNAQFTLPTGGAPVYLELNYKCNQPFEVGVYGSLSNYRSVEMINTSTTWNKIYIHLSAQISTPPLSPAYGLYFRAVRTVQDVLPEIYIDNIKIVSY